jgi:acetolactate synthase I/II/III large subunit
MGREDYMNGALSLVKTALAGGIEVCFANPGTTETPLVAALDQTPGIKPVLGLFEGVCTGAADGYGRMKGAPAMTLLHLGPGFANGIANLHNAKKAGSPVVNVVGEHATFHRGVGAPLEMHIQPLAGSVSGWFRASGSGEELSRDMAEAISSSMRGQVATLIVPHDIQLQTLRDKTIIAPRVAFDPTDQELIDWAAARLKSSPRPAILLGGPALLEPGLKLAARIKALTGCDLLARNFPGRIERGAGLPPVLRIPYFPEAAVSMLSPYEVVVLAGDTEPVTFFGYPGVDSYPLRKDQEKVRISWDTQNVMEALQSLLEILESGGSASYSDGISGVCERPGIPSGSLTPEKICLTLAAIQPEGAIIVDEGLTTAFTYYPLTERLPRHSLLNVSGGSIGFGMPGATGAALACPDRPVINFQADGSALYTVQSLWTQAREGLNVTTLICSNRRYQIVRVELERAGISSPGPAARTLTGLADPPVNWVKIAEGFGVPGVSVDTVEALSNELPRALHEPGPHLIEMVIDG